MRKPSFKLGSLLGLFILLFFLVSSASAHPLDVYVQATYITLTGDNILVDVDMTPGVLIASQVLPWIDTNQDGVLSDAEQAAYVHELMTYFRLQANGAEVPLTLTSFEYPPYVDFSAGTGIIRLHMSAALPQTVAGDYQVFYENTYAPASVNNTYLVNSFIQADHKDQIKITDQQRDYYQHTMLLSYSVTVPQSAAATASEGSSAEAVDSASLQQQLINYLHDTSFSPWLLVVALGLALVLGGLHALTPGHGKTLIAAYLIGSRGTIRHAIALGGIVTLTHTASVIVIGLLALFASQYIVPELLVPMLEIGAGLLVVFIGLKLVIIRWSAWRAGANNQHPHLHRLPDSVRFGDLLAMGVSGGMVPCPEALGILLVAVGLNRVPLGLALIVCFSFGLAVVLIGLGVLLVRFKPVMSRFLGESGRWPRILPLVSALLVTLLGLGVMISALASAALTPITVITVVTVVVLALAVYELVSRLWGQRSLTSTPTPAMAYAASGSNAPVSFTGVAVDLSLLPPRYRTGKPVSNAPMGSADLKLDANGQVAWDQMWTDFCDLALAGGPPHRGTLLEPVSPDAVREKPEAYANVVAEIARGLRLVTGLDVVTDTAPGWIGLVCTDEAMAVWMLRAIIVENVSVRREGRTLFFPAGPDFRLEGEIKNVVTVVAKTNHYWTEHQNG